MNPSTAKERLEELISASGVPLASLTPHAGLELMLRIYNEDPADGYLSCSWGGVTRYGEEEVGFHISRWFTSSGAYLSLVFKVGPPATAGHFPSWIKWCPDLPSQTAFHTAIEASPPFDTWGRSPAAGVAIDYEDIESWHPLFDCWGVRDPSRPVVSMTEAEWLKSDDVSLMLRWFRQEWRGEEADLDRLLQRYFLACCRRIWRLLPQEESRAGVEVAERFVDGLATQDDLHNAGWLAEGAAFTLEGDRETETIACWCDEVSRMPAEELDAMIHSPRPEDDLTPRGLLAHAAHFVVTATCYPGISPKESIERFRLFLPTTLLRETVGNPFRSKSDRPPA